MIAVISGDIIHSGKAKPKRWMDPLKAFLSNFGTSPKNWEIYRGDEFQLELKNPEEALWQVIYLKSIIKQVKGLDVRVSIGVGIKDFESKKITQSNGSAFIHSGRTFDNLKKDHVNLAIQSGNADFDNEMNLFFRFASAFMDEWSAVSSELVCTLIENMDKTQSEIAAILHINQSAVSQRRKRSNFDLLLELNRHYIHRIKQLI